MYNGEQICGGFAYYDADEVDAAIAELKQKLHDAEMQADLAECAVTEYKIDCDKLKDENRKQKRALWLARAERARIESIYWLNLMYDEKRSSVKFTVRRKYGENVKPRQTTRTPEKWFDLWDVVELYCKHKAKEYK